MNKQFKMTEELNELREFLISAGYICWDTTNETMGYVDMITQKLQRRVDIDNPELPICNTNDKLCIYVNINQTVMHGCTSIHAEMELCHENKQGEWCNLTIYALKDENVYSNLEQYESKLVEMWKVFYG